MRFEASSSLGVRGIGGQKARRDAEPANSKPVKSRCWSRNSKFSMMPKRRRFHIEDGVDVSETVRLKHRHLDLRRPHLQKNLILRHRAGAAVRQFLNGAGFLDIETPVLTRSTPEGARDYLVPSRVNPGNFMRLPQSPQLFKQLLMISGFDRYYQIVSCFRDEDLRADRQPEFTQIDMEMSFIGEEDIMAMAEGLMASVFKEALGMDVAPPFQRLTYEEAMARFGLDKPDTALSVWSSRDVSDIVDGSGFKVFASVSKKGGIVKALNAKGCIGFFPQGNR